LAKHDQSQRPEVIPALAASESDQSLLARMAGGDLSAFGVMTMRHQAMVLAVADRMFAGLQGEADDVAQEALLRLWRSAGTLEVGDMGAGPWLRRVVANLCIDRLRVQGRLTPLDESVPEPAEPARQLSALEQRETAVRVDAALKLLPERQRVALALFHYEELSLADIATKLGLSVMAVESLLARARRSLRKDLEAEWRGLREETS